MHRLKSRKLYNVRTTLSKVNKTGLQPVSRPVERILGFFQKGFSAKKWSQNVFKKCLKKLMGPQLYKVWRGAFAAAKPVSKPPDRG